MRSPITRVAELDDRGPGLRLPAWSLRLGRGLAARYIFAGDPDFRRAGQPWRYVEQMGAAHRLEADGVRLTVVAHKRGSRLTEVRLVVEPPLGAQSGDRS